MPFCLERCAKRESRIGTVAVEAILRRRSPALQPGLRVLRSNSARIGQIFAYDEGGGSGSYTFDDIIECGPGDAVEAGCLAQIANERWQTVSQLVE